eukprot:COSAG02_NODE_3710_length_6342_cov_30.226494_2_plen_395_part_00
MLIEKSNGLIQRDNVFPVNAKDALSVRLQMEAAKLRHSEAVATVSSLSTHPNPAWQSLHKTPMCGDSKSGGLWSEGQVLVWLDSIDMDDEDKQKLRAAFEEEEIDGDDLSGFNLKKLKRMIKKRDDPPSEDSLEMLLDHRDAYVDAEEECVAAQTALDTLSAAMQACGIIPLEAMLRRNMRHAREELFDLRLSMAASMVAGFQNALRIAGPDQRSLRTLRQEYGHLSAEDPSVYELAVDAHEGRRLRNTASKIGAGTTITSGAAIAGIVAGGLATGGIGWGLGIAIGVVGTLGGGSSLLMGAAAGVSHLETQALRAKHKAAQGRHGVEFARARATDENKNSDDCELLYENFYIPVKIGTTVYHDWINYTEIKAAWEEEISEGIPRKSMRKGRGT